MDHWRARAEALSNPVLRARYADLAWDLGAKVKHANVRRETAALAADSYAIAAMLPGRSDLLAAQDATRGLRIALQIRDEARIAAARRNLLALHSQSVAAGDCRMEAYDALISDRRVGLGPGDLAGVVADLEGLLLRFGDTPGDILYSPDYVRALGEGGADLAVHFAALFADPRGSNIRNQIAHGLVSHGTVTEGLVLWIVHSLLVIGAWQAPG